MPAAPWDRWRPSQQTEDRSGFSVELHGSIDLYWLAVTWLDPHDERSGTCRARPVPDLPDYWADFTPPAHWVAIR